MATVALLAGGGLATGVRLGASMTALQFAIGALNDIVDAPADAGREPPKPIPAGRVSVRSARVVVAGSAAVGLALAAVNGPGLVALGVLVLAIGFGYDLLAKGTPWSWLPFALGIPILPVYGWFGAAGSLPSFVVVLLPMAILAGSALSIANARADLDTDMEAGTRSVATALGPARSWWVACGLMTAALVIGTASLGAAGAELVPVVLVAAGAALIVAGVLLGRADGRQARMRAWEAQAIGAAIAATGWIAGMLPGA